MSLLNAAMNGGASSGAGYDAVAYSMIRTAVSQDAIDAGWALATRRGAFAETFYNLTGVETNAASLGDIPGDPTAYAAALADQAVASAMLNDNAALTAIAASTSLMDDVITSALIFGAFFETPATLQAIWSTDSLCASLLASTSAHDDARAKAEIATKEAVTTAVNWRDSAGGPLSATGEYLIIGFGVGSGNKPDITMRTLRSGSSANNFFEFGEGQYTDNTVQSAPDFDCAVPIEGVTKDFQLSANWDGIDFHIAYLDCTVA